MAACAASTDRPPTRIQRHTDTRLPQLVFYRAGEYKEGELSKAVKSTAEPDGARVGKRPTFPSQKQHIVGIRGSTSFRFTGDARRQNRRGAQHTTKNNCHGKIKINAHHEGMPSASCSSSDSTPASSSPASPAWQAVKPFLTGALAGCMSASIMTPLDLIKVRQQTSGEPSATRVARSVLQADGFRGFYAGISAVWLRQVIYKGSVLGLYDVFVDFAGRSQQGSARAVAGAAAGDGASRENSSAKDRLSLPLLCACASSAAGLAAVIGNPVDRALVLMQTQTQEMTGKHYTVGTSSTSTSKGKPLGPLQQHSNAFAALRWIVRTEGVRGLSVGVSATAARAVSLNVSFLSGNTYLKSYLYPEVVASFRGRSPTEAELYGVTLASAVSAGVLSCVTSLPADFVKVTLQNQRKGSRRESVTVAMCVTDILRTKGVRGFYTGFATYVAKQAPMATLTLLFQDAIKRTWRRLEV